MSGSYFLWGDAVGDQYFREGLLLQVRPTQYIDPQSFLPIAEKDGGAAHFLGGRSLDRERGGGRRPFPDHRAIVALVADVARRRQLRVGRGEFLVVLGLECPVEGRQRIFDR
jgi:hypothetical protein